MNEWNSCAADSFKKEFAVTLSLLITTAVCYLKGRYCYVPRQIDDLEFHHIKWPFSEKSRSHIIPPSPLLPSLNDRSCPNTLVKQLLFSLFTDFQVTHHIVSETRQGSSARSQSLGNFRCCVTNHSKTWLIIAIMTFHLPIGTLISQPPSMTQGFHRTPEVLLHPLGGGQSSPDGAGAGVQQAASWQWGDWIIGGLPKPKTLSCIPSYDPAKEIK